MAWLIFHRISSDENDLSLLGSAARTLRQRIDTGGESFSNSLTRTGFGSQIASPVAGDDVLAFDAGRPIQTDDIQLMTLRAGAAHSLADAGDTLAAASTTAGLSEF